MMNLGDAERLLLPYFQNPRFKAFEHYHPGLRGTQMKIKEKMKNMDLVNPFGQRVTEVDGETEALFREYLKICKEEFEKDWL